jgi:hypothetical protein
MLVEGVVPIDTYTFEMVVHDEVDDARDGVGAGRSPLTLVKLKRMFVRLTPDRKIALAPARHGTLRNETNEHIVRCGEH